MTATMSNLDPEIPFEVNSTIPGNRAEGLKFYKTPGGMCLGVRPVKRTHLYEIAWESGATLPGELTGRYTSIDRAVADILEYLRKFWDSYEKDVENAMRNKLRKKAKQEEADVAQS